MSGALHPAYAALHADDSAHAAAVRELRALLSDAPPEIVAIHGHLRNAAPYALTGEVRAWCDRVRASLTNW